MPAAKISRDAAPAAPPARSKRSRSTKQEQGSGAAAQTQRPPVAASPRPAAASRGRPQTRAAPGPSAGPARSTGGARAGTAASRGDAVSVHIGGVSTAGTQNNAHRTPSSNHGARALGEGQERGVEAFDPLPASAPLPRASSGAAQLSLPDTGTRDDVSCSPGRSSGVDWAYRGQELPSGHERCASELLLTVRGTGCSPDQLLAPVQAIPQDACMGGAIAG